MSLFLLCLHNKVYLYMVFLTPLQEFRLEIHFLEGQFVHIETATHHFLLPEYLAGLVSPVKIESAHEGLESIAAHMAVMRLLSYLRSKPSLRVGKRL